MVCEAEDMVMGTYRSASKARPTMIDGCYEQQQEQAHDPRDPDPNTDAVAEETPSTIFVWPCHHGISHDRRCVLYRKQHAQMDKDHT